MRWNQSVEGVVGRALRAPRMALWGVLLACANMPVWSQTTDTPPAGYTRCATEGQTCNITGTVNAVYGARSTWTAPRSLSASTACTNAVFGDPLYGVVKSCYVQAATQSTPPPTTAPTSGDTPPAGYTRCATEGQTCNITGTVNAVYGARGTWTAPRSLSASTACTNAVFGDPLYGVVKSCYIQASAAPVGTKVLTLTMAGLGGVGFSDGSSCAASCTKSFNTGSSVTLSAAPAAGYTFAGWGGACSGTGNCALAMDAAKTVTASFAVGTATLAVSVSGSGSVNSTPSGINCGAACAAPFALGSNVTLTAAAAPGMNFTGWSGACSGTGSCTVAMTQASSVGAAFASAGTSPINLSLVPNRTSGVAPLAVFFDASATTSPATAMPFHEIKYTWTFGDPANGANWAFGVRPGQLSKNTAYGGVAGHVFETPGTYTVTLSAFDGRNTSSKTTTITVTDPNAVFSGTKTVCVANGSLPVAGANGCPAGAAVANLGSLQLVADSWGQTSRRILLKRGDAWDTVPYTFFGSSDTIIGAYGSGVPPLVRLTAANTNGITAYSNRQAINNFTLMDIDFVGAGGVGNVAGVASDSPPSNFLALRLRASGTAGISGSGSGVTVSDCDLSNLVGGMGYVGVYVDNASQVAILGNRIYDATKIEHNIRTHATKEVVSNNSLYAPAPTKQALTVRGMGLNYTTAWSGRWAEHVVVSDNDIDAGPNAGWVVQISPTSNGHDERIRDVIFERNYVHGPSGTLLISEIHERGTIRNNLFVPTDNLAYTYPTVSVVHMNGTAAPVPSSHFIYNNSFYRPAGAHPSYAAVEIGVGVSGNTTYPTGTVIKNNLAYAPFSTSNGYNTNPGPVFLGTHAPASLYTLAGNSTDAQMKSVAPGFVTPPASLSDWKPLGGYAIGAGVPVPVWDDFFAKPRTASSTDMGAVQH
jgi:hypothetical protein